MVNYARLRAAPGRPAVMRTGRMGFEGTGHGVTLAFPNERTVMEKTPSPPWQVHLVRTRVERCHKARAFYEQLFGWHVESMLMGNQTAC
jgi:hypothetical protein